MASRRGFLQVLTGALMAAAGSKAKKQAGGAPTGSVPEGKYKVPKDARMKMRELGRTGVQVSILGLGGYHLGIPEEQESVRIVRTALDHGMNFLDNCWDYNDGASEERMGKALQDGYRQKAFVMTKIDGRTGASGPAPLEESLVRLKTDHIDLLQIHEVIRMGDPEQAFQPGNVMDVLKQARQEGKIRFIGFTGHKSPEIHLHMIETADQHGFT